MKGVRSFLDYIFQEVVRLLFDSKSLNPSLLKIVHRLESLCYYPVPPGQPIVPIKGIKQGCYCPLDTFPFELLTKIGLSLERKTSF